VLADFSIVSVPFLAGLGAVTVAIVVVAALLHRKIHWYGEVAVGLLVVVLLAANVGGWVNRHFDYYPTFDDLLGRTSADASSIAGLDCTQEPTKGKVVTLPIPGTESHFDARPAQVYVPPAFCQSPRPKLPVVVLLPGTPGQTSDWTRAGLADVTSDTFASKHDGKAPIIVMADENGSLTGDTECVDGPRGNAETYLTVDVPAFVTTRFATATAPQQWAVGGLSEGGTCGLVLALRHPDQFRTFLDFGGLIGPRSGENDVVGTTVKDLYDGDEAEFRAHEPLDLMQQQRFPELAGWFEVGTDDSAPLGAIEQLVPVARQAGIAVCFRKVPGGEHTFQVWSESYRDALPWLSKRLGLTKGEVECPQG
jgi:S-formylglutathione hydrolase FrmB